MKNSRDKENELKELINNNMLDVFYSTFSTYISTHLSNSLDDNSKIKILSNIIHNIFSGKKKLLNIFELFIKKSNIKKLKLL